MRKADPSKRAFFFVFAAKVDGPPDHGSIPIECSYTIAFSSDCPAYRRLEFVP
jgi:hypothetical protein